MIHTGTRSTGSNRHARRNSSFLFSLFCGILSAGPKPHDNHDNRSPLNACAQTGALQPIRRYNSVSGASADMLNHMGYLSLALYAASFLCYARILYAPNVWPGRLATLLLAAGMAAHYFALLERSQGTHTVPYDDLYGSMSLFAWLLALTYLGLEIFHRQRSVGAFVTLLLVVWMALLELLAPKPHARRRRPRAARSSLFTSR